MINLWLSQGKGEGEINWKRLSVTLYVKTLYDKALLCHSVYLTYMQSTSCEMPGWINHELESRLPGEISTTSDMEMIPL